MGKKPMTTSGMLKKNEKLIIALRRRLHEVPELAHNESETAKVLIEAFGDIGADITKIKGSNGFVVDFTTSDELPTIALRADMDGLPVTEGNTLEYRSRTEGRMHACGHDGHMAIVYGAALMLSDVRKRLNGNVRFIFQPAEEEATTGGAREIIKDGGLDGVDCIVGLHLWPELPEGVVGYRHGPFFAALNRFTISLAGKKFHTARPDLSSDAISASVHILQGISSLVNRRSYPWAPYTVTVHSVNGTGAAVTINGIISSSAVDRSKVAIEPAMDVEGVMRAMTDLVNSTCALYGIKGEIAIMDGYPPLITDCRVTSVIAGTARRIFGEKNVTESPGTLGGEDFSIYLQRVPGTYLLLGTYNRKLGFTNMLHTPEFNFNEKILGRGSALMKEAVLDLLVDRSWM